MISRLFKSMEKPLDLDFVGAPAFWYLAKKKDVKIFLVSMRNIKPQMNRGGNRFCVDYRKLNELTNNTKQSSVN